MIASPEEAAEIRLQAQASWGGESTGLGARLAALWLYQQWFEADRRRFLMAGDVPS